MIKDIRFTITDADRREGRLDKIILARFPTSTRAFVNKAFAAGEVEANGKAALKSDSPACGSVITLPQLMERGDRRAAPAPGTLDVVFEDAAFVVVSKPPGQPCHPVAPGETGTLANALLHAYPEIEGVGDDPMMPGLLHRIDSGTSGLVLCAKNQEAFDAVRAQFAARSVRKGYMAVVLGEVAAQGGVSGHLAHSSSFRGRMRCVSGAKLPKGERPMFAETFYRPVMRHGGMTLLDVTIYTGVTHQIRCQLASIGHPIVGDVTYGAPEAIESAHGKCHLLHASSITFAHPADGRERHVAAALPDIFPPHFRNA